jgi:hypothetical protein
MLLHIADLIHPVRKLTACRHICEDYVARKGKEISRELVAVSSPFRNVKFHHRERVPIKIWCSSFAVVLKPGLNPKIRTKAIRKIVQVSQARMPDHVRFCFSQPARSNVVWKPSMSKVFPRAILDA